MVTTSLPTLSRAPSSISHLPDQFRASTAADSWDHPIKEKGIKVSRWAYQFHNVWIRLVSQQGRTIQSMPLFARQHLAHASLSVFWHWTPAQVSGQRILPCSNRFKTKSLILCQIIIAGVGSLFHFFLQLGGTTAVEPNSQTMSKNVKAHEHPTSRTSPPKTLLGFVLLTLEHDKASSDNISPFHCWGMECFSSPRHPVRDLSVNWKDDWKVVQPKGTQTFHSSSETSVSPAIEGSGRLSGACPTSWSSQLDWRDGSWSWRWTSVPMLLPQLWKLHHPLKSQSSYRWLWITLGFQTNAIKIN